MISILDGLFTGSGNSAAIPELSAEASVSGDATGKQGFFLQMLRVQEQAAAAESVTTEPSAGGGKVLHLGGNSLPLLDASALKPTLAVHNEDGDLHPSGSINKQMEKAFASLAFGHPATDSAPIPVVALTGPSEQLLESPSIAREESPPASSLPLSQSLAELTTVAALISASEAAIEVGNGLATAPQGDAVNNPELLAASSAPKPDLASLQQTGIGQQMTEAAEATELVRPGLPTVNSDVIGAKGGDAAATGNLVNIEHAPSKVPGVLPPVTTATVMSPVEPELILAEVSAGAAAAGNRSGAHRTVAAQPLATPYAEHAAITNHVASAENSDLSVLGQRDMFLAKQSQSSTDPALPGTADAAPAQPPKPGNSSLASYTMQAPLLAPSESGSSLSGRADLPPALLNPAAQARWSDEFVGRFSFMLRDGVNEASLQLDPPELGRLDIRIATDRDQAVVLFNVQNSAARDALEAALPRLRDMFEQNGMQLAHSEVTDNSQSGREHSTARDHLVALNAVSAEEQNVADSDASGDLSALGLSDSLIDYYI